MAMHRMTYRVWAKLLAPLDDSSYDYKRWMGASPGAVAGVLGVSRQRVWQLVQAGRLEMVCLSDKEGGDPSAWLVTDASLERLLKSRPGAQQDLPLARAPSKVRARSARHR